MLFIYAHMISSRNVTTLFNNHIDVLVRSYIYIYIYYTGTEETVQL